MININSFKKIINNKIVHNIILVSGGTVLAQLVSILSSPIVTRIYTPEQHGILIVFTSLVSLFAGAESLRYESAIPIADNDKDAINVLSLCFFVLLCFSSIVFLILVISGESILKLFSAEILINYIIFIPIGILLYGFYQIMMMWNFREKSFDIISQTKITQSISSAITKIVLGVIRFGPLGLIIGSIVGQSAGFIRLSKGLFKEKRTLLRYVSLERMKFLAIRYKKFPIFQLPSTFLSRVSEQIPVLFIASLYGSEVIGLYGLAKSIVNMPMILVGTSVGDVFYGEASSIGKREPLRLKKLSNSIFKKLFFIGLFPLFIFIYFAPKLFTLIFGGDWLLAGEYAKIISLLSFVQLIFQPISRVYDVYEKQKDIFIISIGRVILVFLAFLISKYLKLGIKYSLMIYVMVMTCVYLITYLNAQKIINNEISKYYDI